MTLLQDKCSTSAGTIADRRGSSVLWLYGVIPGGQAPPEVSAIPLSTVQHGALVALVESVPKDEFAPEVLEARFQSIEWVAAMARRHQDVLSAAMLRGAVIPARLCTLFSGPDTVTEALAAGEAKFTAALSRVAGRWEWGLKVFCDERRLKGRIEAEHPEMQRTCAGGAGATPGLAYILEKRRAARAAELTIERIDEIVDQVLDEISPYAVEIHIKPPPAALPPSRDDLVALNLAALVERGGEEAFRAGLSEVAARFGPEGFTFQVSGPWAPYSFCEEAASS